MPWITLWNTNFVPGWYKLFLNYLFSKIIFKKVLIPFRIYLYTLVNQLLKLTNFLSKKLILLGRKRLKYANCIAGVTASPSQKVDIFGMTINWNWWSGSRTKECRAIFHCHNFQVHSEPEWKHLLVSHRWVKYICLKMFFIIVEFLMTHKCM